MSSMNSACPGFMSPQKLNPVEPPWYGPVCPVVWEGRRREASPYPDLRPYFAIFSTPPALANNRVGNGCIGIVYPVDGRWLTCSQS